MNNNSNNKTEIYQGDDGYINSGGNNQQKTEIVNDDLPTEIISNFGEGADEATEILWDDEGTWGAEVTSEEKEITNPVTGWLVITSGPGKGSSHIIKNNRNSIGRGDQNDVTLNFGDQGISRNAHGYVTYDPRGKKFYIQSGESGSNLLYINDAPVLAPLVLSALEEINIGETNLKFIPLCGEEFSW